MDPRQVPTDAHANPHTAARSHATAIRDPVHPLEGASNREIASRLGVSEQTVKNQLTIMYEKTGVQNRLQLALEGIRLVRRAPDSSLHARRVQV